MSFESDINAAITESSLYQPYGASLANSTQSSKKVSPYSFSGKEQDGSGLYYFEARYYDPVTTRFISPDPLFAVETEKCIESIVECNLYQYTGNNPVNYLDLMGLDRYEIAAEVVAVFAGGGKGAASVYLNTDNGEIGGSFSIGPRAGLDVGAGLEFSSSESHGVAVNDVSVDYTVDIEAGALIGSYSHDIVSSEDGIVSLDPDIRNGEFSFAFESNAMGAASNLNKFSPRFGASVGPNISLSGSSSIIPDTYNAAKEVGADIASGIGSGVDLLGDVIVQGAKNLNLIESE